MMALKSIKKIKQQQIKISSQITMELYNSLEKEAIYQARSLSQIIEMALVEYLVKK